MRCQLAPLLPSRLRRFIIRLWFACGCVVRRKVLIRASRRKEGKTGPRLLRWAMESSIFVVRSTHVQQSLPRQVWSNMTLTTLWSKVGKARCTFMMPGGWRKNEGLLAGEGSEAAVSRSVVTKSCHTILGLSHRLKIMM